MFRNLAPFTIWLLVASFPVFAEESATLAVKSRTTCGPFGPPRSSSLVAGDLMHIQQTVSGLTHDSEGYFDYSVSIEALNLKREVLSSSESGRLRRQDVTSVSTMPDAFVTTPEFKPGTYFHVVRITDNISGKSVKAETRIQVVEPKGVAIFQLQCGLVQTEQSSFPNGGATAVVGDILRARFVIANFATDDSKMNCKVMTTIFDADGKQMKWGSGDNILTCDSIQSRYEPSNRENCGVALPYLRAGKFIVRIHVEDLIGKTEATEYLPFQILDAPDWSMPKLAQKKQSSEKKLNR